MQTIHDEKEQQSSENQDLTKKKAKLELNIKDIQDELEGDKSARVTIISLFCSLKNVENYEKNLEAIV